VAVYGVGIAGNCVRGRIHSAITALPNNLQRNSSLCGGGGGGTAFLNQNAMHNKRGADSFVLSGQHINARCYWNGIKTSALFIHSAARKGDRE
jgi:hypothetical protein